MDIREQIEQYALGRLTGAELQHFEAKMAADPDLAAEVALECELFNAVRQASEVDLLRGQLNVLEGSFQVASTPPPPTPHTRRTMRYYLIAAAVAGAVIAALYGWFFRSNPTPDELFTAYFRPSTVLEMNMERGGAQQSAPKDPFLVWVAKAERAYENRNLTEALDAWNQAILTSESTSIRSELYFRAGLTALEAGQATSACYYLEQVPESRFPNEQPWYLALAYLKLSNIGAAKPIFDRISASTSPMRAQAKEILAALE